MFESSEAVMAKGNAAILMIALALAASSLQAQESSLTAGGGPEWKGLDVRFLTKVEPPGSNARAQLPGAVLAEGDGVAHHIINDDAHKRSFGYDLRLEPATDGLSAQVRIEPLNAPRYSVQTGWTMMRLPKYPIISNVRLGDTVALDLLVNTATGQKIVDYRTLERADRPDPKRAHDFSLDDVMLSLDRPRVLVNGKPVESTGNFLGGTAAAVVWIYLRGHGRFILSLFPNENLGFQKNGLTGANALTFRDGASEFRLECSSSVAPGDGPYNLYIVHEPDWRPYSAADPIEVGSADKAQLIVGKR
jgi:hypothetical protein